MQSCNLDPIDFPREPNRYQTLYFVGHCQKGEVLPFTSNLKNHVFAFLFNVNPLPRKLRSSQPNPVLNR
jgi:hypothetical protein